jgi:hypothetical protein
VDGTVQVELRGANPANLDQLFTSGRANLKGTLQVNLAPGYKPVPGDSFEVLRFGSASGTFGAFQGLQVANDLYLQPSLTPTNLVLLAVTPPQPVLSSTGVMTANGFRFSITEAAGLNVIVDATEDFSQWTPISTNLNCPVLLEILDTDAKQYVKRFYRARLN